MTPIKRLPVERPPLPVVYAADAELDAHAARLEAIDKGSGGTCLWKRLGLPPE